MTVTMDDEFAAQLRAALIKHIEEEPQRHRRGRRKLAALLGGGVLVMGGGVAVATGVLPLPGTDVVTSVAAPVTATRTGTATVDLGEAPAGTTAIAIQLMCLSAGHFFTEDGANMVCGPEDAGHGTMGWQLAVQPGQRSTTIRAGAGESWRLVATYSMVETTAWGVNADGQTYGVANDSGTPDLIAAIATNGELGYIYSTEMLLPAPTSLQTEPATTEPRRVTVYASDGRSVIGEFVFSIPTGAASAAP
ncbi:MAG: hypothetical protein JWM93_3612 [Frankiales bacterium]|nr:hypothetical protein [Frankiales bacterium]